MTSKIALCLFAFAGAFLVVAMLPANPSAAEEAGQAPSGAPREGTVPATVAEARGRARLLHETLHGTLQVVHRDFFRAGETAIPSKSLKDVFLELARSHQVEVRWLAVNAKAMDVDHEPRTEFERAAVAALTSGQAEFEAIEPGTYRYAGSIRLASQCLKCHLPNCTSTADRQAALVITMPLSKP